MGLIAPTEGSIDVLGCRAGSRSLLDRVAFVAQDAPVYARMTIRQHLRMGAYLNEHWDGAMAEDRVEHLGLDPGQKAGSLSGGQRSQLALTLAVAKRPELLILDEPVASLDPLARREFLQGLMQIVAAHGVSVVLSSHVLVDLERVCDHLIVLADSQVQLAGDVDDLVATHHRLIGPRRDPRRGLPSDQDVVEESHTERQSTYLVHADGRSSTPRGRSNRSPWTTSSLPT